MLKKALITGSAQGIGRAIALDLASKGFDIAVHYRHSADKATEVAHQVGQFGVQAITCQADVTQPDQAKNLVESAAEGLGGLSVVINNVGDYLEKPASEITFADWQQTLDSNLNSAFYITQTAIPYLKQAGWGRIVNFACANAHNIKACNLNTAYIVAKSGVIIYTKSLAKELAPLKITANIIAPGIAENSFDVEEIVPRLPLKRAATLGEMCRAVWFFVDPEAAYITGQVLEVSGGWNL
jgi:NAD(P)-dependent dehydrogenase (short-subunit alcohol dehydrogenase family)